MTNEQFYLAIGVPTVINTALTALLMVHIKARFDALDRRFDHRRDRWRAEPTASKRSSRWDS